MTDQALAGRVRANFRFDLVSAIFGAALFGFVVPFMPIIVRRQGGSEFEVSLVVAAAFIGHAITPLGAYVLSGRPAVRTITAVSALARVAFLVGILTSPTPLLLATSYVLFWVVALSTISAYTTLLQGMYPDDQRATAMGRVRVGASLAGIVAATAGGALIDLTGERQLILAGAVGVSLLGTVSFAFIRPDDRHREPRAESPLRLVPMVLADRVFRRYLLAFTVLGFGNLMGATLYPLLLVDRYDASPTFVGLYTATSAAFTMLGYFFWGRRIDRGSSLSITLWNFLLVLGLPLTYLVAPEAVYLLPAAAITGFTLAAGDLTFFTNMVELAPRGKAADYMSAQSFVLGVRGTIAPFAASALLLATDATTLLGIVLTLMAVGLVLLYDATRRALRHEPVVAQPRPVASGAVDAVPPDG